MPSTSPNEVQVMRGSELGTDDQTAGMDRQVAFETDQALFLRLVVDGDKVSDWHHHGDHHIFGYLLEGEGRWEYGNGDDDVVTIEAGDFWHIPPRTIHRDINPMNDQQTAIVAFVGSGPMAIEVSGPDAEVVIPDQ